MVSRYPIQIYPYLLLEAIPAYTGNTVLYPVITPISPVPYPGYYRILPSRDGSWYYPE
jgi:hypothetical protein